MSIQTVRRLSPDDLTTHQRGLRDCLTANPRARPDDVRQHLEPLLKHYFYNHTIPETAAQLQHATGSTWGRSALGSTAKRWGIPSPGKSSGRSIGVSGNWASAGVFVSRRA